MTSQCKSTCGPALYQILGVSCTSDVSTTWIGCSLVLASSNGLTN